MKIAVSAVNDLIAFGVLVVLVVAENSFAAEPTRELGVSSPLPSSAGMIDVIQGLLPEISDPRERAASRSRLASIQAAGGETAAATTTFEMALQDCEGIQEPRSRSWALGEVALEQMKAKQLDRGLRATRLMGNSGLFRLASLAEDYAIEKNVAMANQLVSDAVSMLKQEARSGDLTIERMQIAKALDAIGDRPRAAEVLDQAMKIANAVPEVGRRVDIQLFLMDYYARSGRIAEAKATLALAVKKIDSIKDAGQLSNAQCDIVGGYVRCAELSAALNMAQSIRPEADRARVLSRLASVQSELCEFDAAKTTIGLIKEDFAIILALNNLAVQKFLVKLEIETELSEMEKIVGAMGPNPKVPVEYAFANKNFGLARIASLWARSGQTEKAVQQASQIQNARSRAEAIVEIIRWTSERGELKAAWELAASLKANEDRREAYFAIASKMVKLDATRQ